MIAEKDGGEAEFDGYRPAVVLSDREHRVVANLPLGAWAQVRAWHRDVNARPLLIRDMFGQIVSIERSFIAQAELRDLDAVVGLEKREKDVAARRVTESE